MTATTAPTRCTHAAAEQVHNAAGEPVRLLCRCGREWRILPAEWAVQVDTVAGLEREGGDNRVAP